MRKKNIPRPRRRTPPDASPLAAWLHSVGWTQVEFAAECARHGVNVSQTVISRWVRGLNPPSPMSRQLIARATAGAVSVGMWPEKKRRAA